MGGHGLVLVVHDDCSLAVPKGAEPHLAVQKELQEKLAQRGLPKSGNKAELAQRLHAALAEEQDMLLQDQMEARDELQRQFQESIINPTGRCALCKHHIPACIVYASHFDSCIGASCRPCALSGRSFVQVKAPSIAAACCSMIYCQPLSEGWQDHGSTKKK